MAELSWEPELVQVQHMLHHHMWGYGLLKLCPWEHQGTDQPLSLETLPHTQEAHAEILFSCNLQSHSATVFQHAVSFLFWIFISCSSVCSFAFSYGDILEGGPQHTMPSRLLTAPFLISVLPANFISLDCLSTAIWQMHILNRVKPNANFTQQRHPHSVVIVHWKQPVGPVSWPVLSPLNRIAYPALSQVYWTELIWITMYMSVV